jgi:hypothetical protein
VVGSYLTHQEPTKGRELVPLVVGSYLTHGPSNVACMQIVRFDNNERSRTSIPANTIFLSIAEANCDGIVVLIPT